jgi:hypothetical protein
MSSLWAVGAASLVAAAGLVLLVGALAGEPRRADARCRRMGTLGAPVCAAAMVSTGVFLALGLVLPALTASGVAMAAGAGVVALIRARPGDDGGDDGGDDEPDPEPPGGDAIDWERFEADFWDYVRREARV